MSLRRVDAVTLTGSREGPSQAEGAPPEGSPWPYSIRRQLVPTSKSDCASHGPRAICVRAAETCADKSAASGRDSGAHWAQGTQRVCAVEILYVFSDRPAQAYHEQQLRPVKDRSDPAGRLVFLFPYCFASRRDDFIRNGTGKFVHVGHSPGKTMPFWARISSMTARVRAVFFCQGAGSASPRTAFTKSAIS